MSSAPPTASAVSAGGSSATKRKKVSDKDLDLSNANRGVWLVKVRMRLRGPAFGSAQGAWPLQVPKYISDRWESSSEGTEVGKLRIARRQNARPNVAFSLSDEIVAAKDSTEAASAGGATLKQVRIRIHPGAVL